VPSYTVGYIDVYRNGVRLVSTDFTATTGTTVVLVNACTSGDSVVTESFLVSSVLNAIPATAGAVAGSYLAGGAVTLTTQVTGILPVANGGTGLSAGGPAFSAYKGSNQSISAGVYTKIEFGTEEYDTNNNFNSSTTYRFTPTVAGYYLLTSSILLSNANNRYTAYLYKNGSNYISGPGLIGNGTNDQAAQISCITYANGTTDYFEIYIQGNNATTAQGGTAPLTIWFQGFLARSA